MASVILQTKTVSTGSGSSLEQKVFYSEDLLPNTQEAFLADEVGFTNGVVYREGHLVMVMDNFPDEISYSISSEGDLIVAGDDASKYSIDSNGDLIYTP